MIGAEDGEYCARNVFESPDTCGITARHTKSLVSWRGYYSIVTACKEETKDTNVEFKKEMQIGNYKKDAKIIHFMHVSKSPSYNELHKERFNGFKVETLRKLKHTIGICMNHFKMEGNLNGF